MSDSYSVFTLGFEFDLEIMNETSPFEEIQSSLHQNTYRDIIAWWEGKRLTFNIAVGISGILGFISGAMFTPVLVIMLGAILYALAANLLFTAGWASELFLRFKTNDRMDFGRHRRVIFTLGLIGSVILTLFLSVFAFIAAQFSAA